MNDSTRDGNLVPAEIADALREQACSGKTIVVVTPLILNLDGYRPLEDKPPKAHLFLWHADTGGGLAGYEGVFDTLELAEAMLISLTPPMIRADHAETVELADDGKFRRIRSYVRSTCWFDAGGKFYRHPTGGMAWVIIGNQSSPMRLVDGQLAGEKQLT